MALETVFSHRPTSRQTAVRLPAMATYTCSSQNTHKFDLRKRQVAGTSLSGQHHQTFSHQNARQMQRVSTRRSSAQPRTHLEWIARYHRAEHGPSRLQPPGERTALRVNGVD